MTMTLSADDAVALAADSAAPTIRPARSPARVKARARLRWLLPSALALILAIGGGAYWYAQQSQAVVPVSTVTVGRGTLEETVLASGTLEASSLVSVGAQVSGIIESVNVELGDNVKVGDVLAEIDSLDQENALKAAKAALANIEAQLAAEEANLARLEKALARAATLGAGELITQAEYDTAEANVASSKAQLSALDAQIEQATLNVTSAQLDLDRTTITATSDGTIVAVLVDQGQTVNASQTAPTILKVANLDTMQIKAEISEADVTRVQAGQKVYFTVLGDPDTRIEAVLKSVEPAPTSIENDTVSTDTAIYYNGIFEVPNPDHALRIAMTAQVTVILDEATDVLTLPASALGNAAPDGSYTVSVLDPATGASQPRQVTVGLNNKVTAEITSGLNEGDRVVVASKSTTSTPAATSGGMGAPPMGL